MDEERCTVDAAELSLGAAVHACRGGWYRQCKESGCCCRDLHLCCRRVNNNYGEGALI